MNIYIERALYIRHNIGSGHDVAPGGKRSEAERLHSGWMKVRDNCTTFVKMKVRPRLHQHINNTLTFRDVERKE